MFYVSGGAGTTTFAGDDRYTIAYAFGHRTVFSDNVSFDIEMRDLIWDIDLFGTEETTNNLELTVAFTLFF